MKRILLSSILAAICIYPLAVAISTNAHAELNCWTAGKCAAKCNLTWMNYGWKSARDCVANFPCSQYPKTCKAK